ncbi:MAG: hypothetical protein WCG75_08200 [Armatimonadota bacterium]
MKSLSTLALVLLGGIATAQTDAWYASRFGFNAPAPDLFKNQTVNDYKNYGFNDGIVGARWNNSPAMLTGAGITQSGTGKSYSDPTCHLWTDLYEITDLLPKNTWVRVTGNLANHFPDPYNPSGQVNKERNVNAIVNRIMFRGSGFTSGLNILWNITPGVYPTEYTNDSWINLDKDAVGAKLVNAINTGDSAKRDWWRPYDVYLPYLKKHVQAFVYDVNDAAAQVTRSRTTGTMTENFISRMAFQMGNEPAAGHPGGSVDGQVGSWEGTGRVLEGTMAGLDYKPRPATMTASQVPTTFGTNPLTMPAFSMFAENVDAYRLNYVKGQIRNIQWAGSMSPSLNEIATYSKEMVGKNWQTQCGRRALHFNSPVFRWKFNPNSAYNSTNTNDLLTSSLIDPAAGRWETPAEYAKRWVAELEKQVDLVANLPMPGTAKIVDITECYFRVAESGGIAFNPGTQFADGTSPNYQSMTMDQVRAMSRSYKNVNGVMVPLPQAMPSRESLLTAIRAELFARDTAKTLTPNLGKIYWWGGYWADPRREAGLCIDGDNNAIGYNPWGDLRLTLSEIKALWNK